MLYIAVINILFQTLFAITKIWDYGRGYPDCVTVTVSYLTVCQKDNDFSVHQSHSISSLE